MVDYSTDDSRRRPFGPCPGYACFIAVDGITQPSPGPRFSRTPGTVGGAVPAPGADNAAILSELGCRLP